MVSSEEENEAKAGDTVEWDVDMDIQLFYAMANHKPVGINKHFQMACIWEKLSNSTAKEISTHDIWKHLETLYDLSMLDDTEPIPFPNHEQPFSLPESEFGTLMKQKFKEAVPVEEAPQCEDVRSPSPKVKTPKSGSRGTASKDSTPKAPAPATSSQRKDSVTAVSTKTRKESGSSHASTDTPSVKSEKDYDRRRDSRDSNASGPRESSSSKKSTSQKEKKSRSSVTPWDSPLLDEDSGRRGRRRANTSTPPATTPAKRRRT